MITPRFLALFILSIVFTNVVGHELDTNYVRRYKNKLVVGYYQSYRRYEITIGQKIFRDTLGLSNLKYSTPNNNASGFEVNYDKISFSFGWKTPVTDDEVNRKGRGNSSAYAFSFTLPNLRIETAYRNYTGFYLENTPQLVKDFTPTSAFIQKPSMEMNSGKAKALYFLNRKNRFSFMSSYSCTERQLKTAGSLFSMASFQFLGMRSKTSLIPNQSVPYFGHYYYDFNRVKSYGYGMAVGYSLNMVILKGLFWNVTFGLGPELQIRTVGTQSGIRYTQLKVGNVADFRTGFGFNGKKWFWIFNLFVDYNDVNHQTIKWEARYVSGSAILGFRFGLREGKMIRKMKENELYQKL